MRIYLDTNVLIDILSEQRPNHDYAVTLLQVIRKSPLTACLSTQSVIDASYVFTQSGKAPLEAFKTAISVVSSIIDIVSIGKDDIAAADNSSIRDYEDAAQISCALNNRCDAIISSDRKFKGYTQLPTYSPQEFYTLLFGTSKL